MSNNNYTAEDIQVLEGLEAVRKRPGMYIGSTDTRGLHNCLREIFDNSVDEAVAGYATRIVVSILKNNSVIISDNGRGIPAEINKKHGVSSLELAMTKLHAGGKFGGSGYKVSSGLHGVGASVVNALAESCRVEIRANNKVYHQEYARGDKKYDVKVENPKYTKIEARYLSSTNRGTTTMFKPDLSVMETDVWNYEIIRAQLKMSAYLTSEVKIILNDERTDTFETFYFEGGLGSFIGSLNRNKDVIQKNIFYVKKTLDDIDTEIAFQYTASLAPTELSFANNIKTIEGGTHITGFRSALTRAINDYAKKNNIVKDNEKLTGDDCREGITLGVSVKIKSDKLLFEGQTKNKLGTTEARSAVETIAKEALDSFFDENPKDIEAIIDKCLLAAKARKAAKAARDAVVRKNPLGGSGLPSKLADCRTKDPTKAEIFIVEGDSAGGSAKDARDPETQAILPLFGKILNAEKARMDQILKETRIETLIQALGAGIGDLFDIKNVRYHKIIIMTDADVDGSHIRTLYLTLLYRHLEELINAGMVYSAVPPLYKAVWGKNKRYIVDDVEKEQVEGELIKNGQRNYTISRFKGLGEMDYDELWETTMNPKTRVLKQITIEDIEEANEVFETLMGKEVAPRKSFIQSNAQSADLDFHA